MGAGGYMSDHVGSSGTDTEDYLRPDEGECIRVHILVHTDNVLPMAYE